MLPSLSSYKGPWNEDAVKHLLRRTMFGAKRGDINLFLNLGLSRSVLKLLEDAEALPNPPLKEYTPTNAAIPDTNILAGKTWVNDPSNDGTILSLIIMEEL